MPSKEHAKRLRQRIEQGATVLTDSEALEAVELFPAWKPETDYTKGNRVREDGLLYRLIPETHHSQSDWPPHLVPAVWARVDDPGEEWPAWRQPLSAEDAYSAGAKVSHQGKHWVNSHGDGNVWEPGVYGWQEQPESNGGGEESDASVRSVEWHQCPEAVREYLANTDYTGVAYTESVIENYAPSPPSPATNTTPIGKTVDGATFYNSIPNVATPFATANAAGTLTPLDQVRWIKSQTANMRDLGGWACDGGKVRYGLIFRSGNLAAVDFDLLFSDLGIRWEIDLTADGEAAFPGKIRHVCHPSYAMYSLADTEAWRTNLRAVMDAATHWEPCVIHCSMGADRTGTLACVLEALLGVSQSNLDKDYELTSFYALRARNGNYQGGTADWAHLISAILALSGNTFRDKCVSFALSVGITIDEINAYRAAMIDGTPETLSPTIETVTVTKSLTYCTVDNAAETVNKYQPYEAVITPNDGYALADVVITMGGTNVTANAYREEVYPTNRGIINIERITGTISISATAEKAEIPNLFDASDPDVVLRGRINSSGVAVAFTDGQLVTGFIPAETGDVFRIETDKSLKTNGHTGMVSYYGTSKAYIYQSSQGSTVVWTFTDSDFVGVCNIPTAISGHDLTGTAYVRFCVAYTSIDNIKIYKLQ